MFNKKSRVLAYTLAKEIPHQQLTEVSGGIAMCHRETFRTSGAADSVDIMLDWTLDS